MRSPGAGGRQSAIRASGSRGDAKGRAIVFWFQVASRLRARSDLPSRIGYLIVGTVYKLVSEWIMGVELPASTKIGKGLVIHHGVGLVVNPQSVIGDNVTLRHGVTIGNRGRDDGCPVIEDDVEIGAGAVILGPVRIGAGSSVGALALVLSDIPAGGRARATPATINDAESQRL